MPGERIGEDNPEEELLFRDLWEDETQRAVVIESLKADLLMERGAPEPHRGFSRLIFDLPPTP
jgi:hypothetical protein